MASSGSDWTPPMRCLVPAEFVAGHADLAAEVGESGAVVSVSQADEVPALSDRIVLIHGDACQQQAACRQVLQSLWQDQGEGEGEEGLFVLLVPSSAAPAIVGTKGQKVLTLMKQTGADIKVSREVLPGLGVQPVTILGGLEEVAAAAIGVSAVLRELAERGRLQPGDFDLRADGASAAGDVRGIATAAQSGQSGVFSAEVAPTRLVFLVSMEVAGRIIGKQGRRILELQQSTGARITILGNSGASLQGTRCGERLLEICGDDLDSRSRGVHGAFGALAEEPLHSGGGGSDEAMVALLVPAEAIGFIIGKGGQTIKEIMSASGASVTFNQDGPLIGGARPALLSGEWQARAEAALAIAVKVDELQHRQSPSRFDSGGSSGHSENAAPRGRSGWQAPRSSPEGGYGPPSAQTRSSSRGRSGLSTPHTEQEASRGGYGPPSAEPRSSMMSSGASWSSRHSAAPRQAYFGQGSSRVDWADGSPAEKALLAGIQASGALDHRLTMRVPRSVVAFLGEISRRSGALFELDDEDLEHQFLTAVGPRAATSLAALCIQEFLSSHS